MTGRAEAVTGSRLLRVCLVSGEYPPDEGGVADYTLLLARALAGAGHPVDVVTARRPGAAAVVPELDAASGPAEARAPDDPTPRVNAHRVIPGWGWRSLPALRRATAVLRPDVVHVQYQAAAYGLRAPVHLAPYWVGMGRAVRLVVTYHDLRPPYLFPKAGRLRRSALLALGRQADLALATNEDDWRALATRLPRERLGLIPIGSNVADQPPPEFQRARFRAAAGIGADEALVGYFGFLNESKGARALLEALALLRAAGRRVTLVMIGGATGTSDPTNAAYLAVFEAELQQRSLAPAVRWTGHLPPGGVSAWLRACDVAALPYRDGASYRRGSLLAALEHGLPVVTTTPAPPAAGGPEPPPGAVPPPPRDGVNAVLVPPDDGAALARAIQRVLTDAALSERLSRGAKDLAAAFHWDAIARAHLERYRALVAGDDG